MLQELHKGENGSPLSPRLAFFFVARTTFLEEVAKFRAARRMWARIMREEFGAKDPAYFNQRLTAADEFTGGGQATGDMSKPYMTTLNNLLTPYASVTTPALSGPVVQMRG